MQILIGKKLSNSVLELLVRHNTDELSWNWGVQVNEMYRKSTNNVLDHDIFEQINNYWAQCPAPLLDEIFDTYLKIRHVFEDTQSVDRLTAALRPLMAKLVSLHSLDDIDHWVRHRSDLLVPISIPRIYDQAANASWTPEKTYLESDYRKLVPLSICVRALIPVWEEFLYLAKDEIGDVFKDYQAFQLISTSNIMNCEPMERLAVFVRHTINKDRTLDAAILQGVSTQDFPEWVLAYVVVKKLGHGDIRGTDPSMTLVTYLHRAIQQKSVALESRMGNIKPKTTGDTSGEGDNNHSKLEGFKIKQAIPAGDVEIVSHYIRTTMMQATGYLPMTELSLINRLNPDPQFLEQVRLSVESAAQLRAERLTKAQVTIAAWVMSEYIPIRALPYLQKDDVVAVIALAQAYLWNKGHHDLAAIVSGIAQYTYDTNMPIIAAKSERMSMEGREAFARMFPYQKRSASSAKTAKSTNTAITAVDEVTEELSYYGWLLTLPKAWTAILKRGANTDRRYLIPDDIRTKLANLVSDLDKKFNVHRAIYQHRQENLLV